MIRKLMELQKGGYNFLSKKKKEGGYNLNIHMKHLIINEIISYKSIFMFLINLI